MNPSDTLFTNAQLEKKYVEEVLPKCFLLHFCNLVYTFIHPYRQNVMNINAQTKHSYCYIQ